MVAVAQELFAITVVTIAIPSGLVVKVIGINTCEVLSTPPGTLLLNTTGGLACCDSWGRKESDTTERPN